MNKRYEKYKKDTIEKKKSSEIEDGGRAYQQKYEIRSNAIKKRYENLKNQKEKCAIQKIFEGRSVKCSRQKTQIIQDVLLWDKTTYEKNSLCLSKLF
ncbi:unnamed protein product [Acanthoscelides obtectus]|uniref:Uncharacterized protein n=1 Tax=Acanthoscelides obtectus TaxID=200917 RepID=A0A9P0KZB9_ACAOB|nr:unnamed protein product [Acanthoscelides obtectus]CAK1623390.1 hypothetical protein AOBTE_LOCUS1975 [Acanthoscelides obtectus]